MPDTPEWIRKWPFAQRVARIPQQMKDDLVETAHDLVEEHGETPYRVRERLKDYVIPRHRVVYPTTERPKGK